MQRTTDCGIHNLNGYFWMKSIFLTIREYQGRGDIKILRPQGHLGDWDMVYSVHSMLYRITGLKIVHGKCWHPIQTFSV